MSTQDTRAGPILIAETEALIALDLEAELQAAGFDTVGPFVTPEELAAYKGQSVAGAVVGARVLGPDPDATLATIFNAEVPVIVISGRDDVAHTISRARSDTVMKPARLPEVVERLRKAMSHSDVGGQDVAERTGQPPRLRI